MFEQISHVRYGQVCYMSMGNLVSMSVDIYLYMYQCMCLCVGMYMCMNMIVSCMFYCARIAFVCTV